MKSILSFCLLFTVSLLCSAQGWEQGVIALKNGETRNGELKWRRSLSVPEVKFKGQKGKESFSLDEISRIELNSEAYAAISLNHLKGDPISLAKEIAEGLYHGHFKEIRCLCDNSFNTVEAYFLANGNNWKVLRKKDIGDRIQEDEDSRSLLGEDLKDLNFSSIPDILELQAAKP